MNSDDGLALVSTLLVLAFLSVVGAAFLSTVEVEVRIAENYSRNMRLRYLAEGGLEEARERLRVSGVSLAEALVRAGGRDQRLEPSTDIDQWLLSDDLPILPPDLASRASGEVDFWGFPTPVARRHVFMRNDSADGAEVLADTNGIFTLVSIARIGDRRYRAEADVMRGAPPLLAVLTLNGAPGTTRLGDAPSFRVDGADRCGQQPLHAIGVLSDGAVASVLAEIPAARQTAFPGAGPSPDVFNVAEPLPGRLLTVAGMERLVGLLGVVATDVYPASGPIPAQIGSVGSWDDPRVVRVDGDAVLGAGTGYGILIVRGAARIEDGFVWNGLILIVGEGRLDWHSLGVVYGATVISRTREAPGGTEPQGQLLTDLGEVVVDFTGAAGGIYYDSCALEHAFRLLPVLPIAVRGY